MLRKILLIIDSIFLVIAVAVGIDYTYYIANTHIFTPIFF